MSRHFIEGADRKIIDATFRIAAQNPEGTFSTRQIAKEAGFSEAIIFKHFGNKRSLILKCLKDSNRRYFEADVEASKAHGDNFASFFNAVLSWFLANPNEARFALKYSFVFPRNKEGHAEDFALFQEDLASTWGTLRPLDEFDSEVLTGERWMQIIFYCIREVVYDAIYLLNGEIEDTPENRRLMAETLLFGLSDKTK